MKTSKTYIVTWDELLYNGLDVDSQLSAAGIDYLVYDVTTSPTKRPNWVIAEKVRYYGHFYNSLEDFAKTPKKERTVAMDIAYSQVLASRKSLPHVKEITDRTEGKAPQTIDMTSNGETINGQSNLDIAQKFAEYLKEDTKE